MNPITVIKSKKTAHFIVIMSVQFVLIFLFDHGRKDIYIDKKDSDSLLFYFEHM
jgi:hypothetical protein